MAEITQLKAASECHSVEFATFVERLPMFSEVFSGYVSIGTMTVTISPIMLMKMTITMLLLIVGRDLLVICDKRGE